MRFTVTALGSTGDRPLAAVVNDVAEYLLVSSNPKRDVGARTARPAHGRGGPAGYYADAGEGPGRWRGYGASELGLTGDVGPDDFRSVLAARHPVSGERLITARGSAARVSGLGTGSATRWSPMGEALYSLRDAAVALGWPLADVQGAVGDGEREAARSLLDALAGNGAGPADPGMGLIPHMAPDGSRWVPESELTRIEALVGASRSPQELLAAGPADEELSLTAAARAVGASPSYLARLCRVHAGNPALAAGTEKDGKRVRAFLVGRRDDRGSWRVRRDELAAFVARRRRPAVRVGYDVTATTEKSFSVLALLGGPEVRREVLGAIEVANDVGVDWLEAHAACARDGRAVIGVTGWTVASFRHLTSRRLDPFVHHHNVVANTAVDAHGQRRALDARRLYRRVAAASALATAQARYELVTRLGVEFRPGRRGGWEVDGISDDVLDEFSQRSREIADAVRELEDAFGRRASLAEVRNVVATSRPAKDAAVDEPEVVARWWDRAHQRGLSPAALAACQRSARPTALTREARSQVLAAAADAVTRERSVFSRSDVLVTLADLPSPTAAGPLVVPASELERLADEFLASPDVVLLGASSGRHDVLHRQDGTTVAVGGDREPEYSTTQVLALQARTLDGYEARQATGVAVVGTERLGAALGRFPELSPEQQALVRALCTSGDGAQSAIGRPGTGKTHTLRAAVTAWHAAGYRVVGAAVKAEAARHLAGECGIEAEPLAWYLHRLDDPLRSPLDARTVLIIDEASTVADRDLHAILAAAERAGAAVRLVGDPAQHGAVEAGGLWRVITERHRARTPELTTGRRVRHAGDQAAADALRTGDAEAAIAALEASGHLEVVAGEHELYVAMVQRWWQARQSGATHPMVDRRNDRRLVLNRLARAVRQQTGELGDTELHAAGGRRFAAGDEVVARMGARHLHAAGQPAGWLRNGARGTVLAVTAHPDDLTADRLRIDFDEIGTIDVPRSFFDEHDDDWGRRDVGIDHAYAVTSYAVQGLTFDESTSHLDTGSVRSEAYVDITRGREGNHVLVSRNADPLAGERLPSVPPPTEVDQVELRLARPDAEAAAVDLDPLAGAAALHARSRTLAQLTRERLTATTEAERTLAAAAERIRESQVARAAATRTDPYIAARLVPRPAAAHLAADHDELLRAMAVYRARWEPRPGHGDWTWALGRPIDHPASLEERTQLVARLERHSLAVVASCRPPGIGPITPPTHSTILALAATGRLGQLDRSGVTNRLDAVNQGHHALQIASRIRRPVLPHERAGIDVP